MGGRYQDRLIIGRSLDGAEGVHRLHWTQPSGGWYRGMAFELGERLVGVRLPGVLVRQTSYDVGAYRVTTRHSEVGRDVLWYVGAYRLEGDALAGVELSNSNEGASCGASGQRCLVPVRWVRAGTPIEAPAPPPVEAPPVEAPAGGAAGGGGAARGGIRARPVRRRRASPRPSLSDCLRRVASSTPTPSRRGDR
ncbi:MAG: hypothetical protein M5U28_47235 [Sandaracinaceae bacterium]|nr:hypothetical protein [Sandaracinaceae bacterium]